MASQFSESHVTKNGSVLHKNKLFNVGGINQKAS